MTVVVLDVEDGEVLAGFGVEWCEVEGVLRDEWVVPAFVEWCEVERVLRDEWVVPALVNRRELAPRLDVVLDLCERVELVTFCVGFVGAPFTDDIENIVIARTN